MANLFSEVVIVGSALEKSLHYSVPPELAEVVQPGSVVSVGLGRRKAAGVVLSLGKSLPDLPETIKIRPILAYSGKTIPNDLLRLSNWISGYYFYPLGEVLSLVIPASEGVKRQANAKRKIEVETCDDVDVCTDSPIYHSPAPLKLTSDQNNAVDAIVPAIENPSFQPFVLYGVTGSGKTEIYLRIIEAAARAGKGALVLVPEIALSTQMEAIFRERFGRSLAVWHSAVSQKVKRRQGAEILSGLTNIVLGARSAVLSAIKNPGLIVVDEEHDPAYKQEDRLRYNARDVALMRAKILGIPIVLGSATPSLQTILRSRSGSYRHVALPSRILGRPLPDIEVVDMKRESGKGGIFSTRLRDEIGRVLQAGNQALIFLNRRGYAKYYLCNACGLVLQCISCSLTLTYHKNENSLRCHYCGFETPLPERCPTCGHTALFAHGFGTERVEKEVGRLFPGSRIVRVDRDTMSSHEKLLDALEAVRSGRANILLGTQMIAKGHDFPNITLVGVINADAGLQVSDFRAGENLVQLLFQVAGRAGRGDEPGRVILQTYNPYHYTIDSLLKMDYDGFCEMELSSRKGLQYPPFTRLLKLLVTAKDEKIVRTGAELLASLCREKAAILKESGKHIAVLGPSPSPYVKLKDRFRWQVFIKAWGSAEMQEFSGTVLDCVRNDSVFKNVQVTVDRDPASDI